MKIIQLLFRRERAKQFKKILFLTGGFAGPLVFLMVWGSYFARDCVSSELPSLKISEIMYDFKGSDNDNEWIEVYNDSDKEVKLKKVGKYKNKYKMPLRICTEIESNKCSESVPVYSEKENVSIEGGEIFLISDKNNSFKESDQSEKVLTLQSNLNLGNSDDELLGLVWIDENIDNDGKIVDKANYSSSWGADGNRKTLERKHFSENFKNEKDENWTESSFFWGTPGLKYQEMEMEYSKDIKINEIFPNPLGDDKKGEFIEIVNLSDEEVDLKNWSIEDKSGKSFFFREERKLAPGEFMKIERELSGLILNNSGDEFVKLIDPAGGEADKVSYKNSTEGHSYALNEKGEWKWTPELTPKSENKFPEPAECPDNLVISEIFPNPKEDEAENEWVEIYNPGEEEVSLEGCYLADENLLSKKDVKEYFSFSEKDEVKAEDYLVVKRDRFGFGMNNGGEKVSLRNAQNEEISGVEYGGSEEGLSYALDGEDNWKWTKILTPEEDNRFPRPKKYSEKIRINEFLPNPEGRDKGKEWIEFVNLDNKKVDLADWKIKNQSGRSFKIEKLSLDPGEIKVLKLKETSFSIRNSGGWLSLENPNEKQVDKVEYPDPSPSGSSRNKNKKGGWSWSHFTTPGGDNKPNHPPKFEIDKPEKIYENIRAYFKLKNLKDADGDELKFRWEFGDGRKSYQKETSHIYKEEDEYLVRVRVSDPSVDIFKEFELDVKEYPDYEIEIVKLLPNPVGRDSEGEKIWIKNKSEEDVNLRGWFVATGKNEDSLSNHPIRENFEIKAGEVKALQRKNCAFSLLNKKATVTLRYPDGDKAHQVKYEKDAVEEDEFYEMESESGEWIWVLPDKKPDSEKKGLESKKIEKEEPAVKSNSKKDWKNLISVIVSDERNKQSQTISKLIVENWKFHKFSGRVWQKNDFLSSS